MSMDMEHSWLAAEKTCFSQLVTRTQSKENVNAFRGFVAEDVENWGFMSGGLDTGPISRYWGPSPCWPTFSIKARIVLLYGDRDAAMLMCGRMVRAFKETSNFNQIGNVMWLRMKDFPGEPDVIPLEDDKVVWKIEIPLELVFNTGAEYPAS